MGQIQTNILGSEHKIFKNPYGSDHWPLTQMPKVPNCVSIIFQINSDQQQNLNNKITGNRCKKKNANPMLWATRKLAPTAKHGGAVTRCRICLQGKESSESLLCPSAASHTSQSPSSRPPCASAPSGSPGSQPSAGNRAPADKRGNTKHLRP